MNKSKIIDLLIVILFYVGIATFPIDLLSKNIIIKYLVQISLLILLIVLSYFFLRNKEYLKKNNKKFELKNFLLLSPVFVVCFSNYFYALIFNEKIHSEFIWIDLLGIISIILIVLIEEMIFRFLLIENIESSKPLVKILISSSIFALCHLTVFFSSLNPLSLVVVLYSFGIGILLGFLYYYTHSLVVCIIMHFMFNLLNDFIFTRLFSVSNSLWFYLINVIIAIIIGLYLFVIYLLKLRRVEN